MTEPGRAVIHHHLVRRSHADLVVDLLTLADRYPQMRDYLLAQISVAHAEGIVQTHKDVLTRHFFPPRSVGNTNSVLVRTMLREGWSVAPSHAHAIDLTIHAVELGVRFLNEYGYRDRVLMAELLDIFDQALRDIQAHAFQEQFQQRCRAIIDGAAQSGLGWADDLLVCYESCFVD